MKAGVKKTKASSPPITLAMLQTFCHATKRGLTRPFGHGRFTYASDGTVLLRTDWMAGSYGGMKAPSEHAVEHFLRAFPNKGLFRPLPEGIAEAGMEEGVGIGAGLYRACSIKLIATLPQVTATTTPMDLPRLEGFTVRVIGLAFKFTGGIGLLCPVKTGNEEVVK